MADRAVKVLLLLAPFILTSMAWIWGDTSRLHSDSLVPVAWAYDAIHFPHTLSEFQLPRIPSFVPDLAGFLPIFLLAADFRIALFLYGVLQSGLIFWSSSIIVSNLTQRGFALSAAMVVTTFLIAESIALYEPYFMPHHTIFRIMEHSGSLVMVLLCTAIFQRLLKDPTARHWTGLFLFSTLAVTSNKIFLLTFVAPICLATLYLRVARSVSARFFWQIVIFMGVAILSGLTLSLLPPTQMTPPVSGISSRISLFVVELSAYFARVWWPYVPLFLIPLLSLLFMPKLFPNWLSQPQVKCVWMIATIGVVLQLAFCAAFFVDVYSMRYLPVAFYWPIIFLAGAATKMMPRDALRYMLTLSFLSCTIMGVTVAKAASHWPVPHDELAECLLQNRNSWGLRSGLAGYWVARPAVVGSSWKLQIAQIFDGKYYHWGDNLYWLRHSFNDIAAPPEFNYVVLDEFNSAERIRNRYGSPNRIESCGEYPIWIYGKPIFPQT